MSEDGAAPKPLLPQAPPSRAVDHTVWVGLFLIVAVVSVLSALFALTDAAMFRGRYIVTTQVKDAGGIRRGDPVQMRGVNIGRVLRFQIGKNGSVAIQLEIEGEYGVPADSHVELKSSGLLGGMVAEVVPGVSDKRLRTGDALAGSSEEGMGAVATRIASQAETALGRVDTLLSKDMIDQVHGSSAELKQLLETLSAAVKEQRTEVAGLTASLRRSAQGLEKTATGPELDRIVKRLDTVAERADSVAASLDRSSKSMEGVLGRIERGEGTLGKLSKDELLYKNLSDAAATINQTSANTSRLVDDIRKNPRKYLKISVF